MADKHNQELMDYYDERAQEYDEIYVGKGPAIPNLLDYKKDVTLISNIVSTFGKGHLVDIACGTGFWMSYYAKNCSQITFSDQSDKMLSESKMRAVKLGLNDKCHFAQGNFFEVSLGNYLFDCALVGFFISHIPLEQEQTFFSKLKKILKPNGQLMLIDSAWSSIRAKYRKKEGMQERLLSDGRKFTIYKRYFDKSDIDELFERYHFKLEYRYIGNTMFGALGWYTK